MAGGIADGRDLPAASGPGRKADSGGPNVASGADQKAGSEGLPATSPGWLYRPAAEAASRQVNHIVTL